MVDGKDDIQILKGAIALVDWASNTLGTELAEYIFKSSTKSLHFVDTGDVAARKNEIPKLLQVLADTKSILSIKVNNLVGAGDSWDAADIVGYLAGLDAKERLTFSNAYVSLYISNPNSEPATMNEVIDLLQK